MNSVSFGFRISYRLERFCAGSIGSSLPNIIMASQISTASSHSLNVLQEYYKDVLVEGKQKWECMVCHRTLSSKQRVEFHLHKIHGKGPIVRKYKRYVDDPILPVPKRTLHHWKKKTVNCTDPYDAEMLVPVTEISQDQTHFNQDNTLPPACRDTTESVCGLEKEDSVNDFRLPVQHQPFLLEDDNDASSYYISCIYVRFFRFLRSFRHIYHWK